MEILEFIYSLRKEIENNKSPFSKQINKNIEYKNGYLEALNEIIFNFGDEELDERYK